MVVKCWICRREIEEADGVIQALPVRIKRGKNRNFVVAVCVDCFNKRMKKLARERKIFT